jgi:hypothetical protein
MISQLKFKGMGIQINLLFEVGLVIFSNIVINDCDRDDQGNILLPVVIDDF